MCRLLIVLPALALCCGCIGKSGSVGSSARQPPEPGKYTCYRAVDNIVLDGKLREKSWKKAPGTGNFMMYDGKQQSPLSTTAKLVWDDQALYIAFECDDPDIYATHEKRDEALYSQDVVEVFIMRQDDTEDHYVEYEISPRGTLFDIYLTAPFKGKLEWTSEAFGAGAVFAGTLNKPADGDKGYTVEIRIPFADLYGAEGASPEDGSEIRMNLYRIDYSTPEEIGKAGADAKFITWSPTDKINFHQPDKFGVVTFRRSPVGR
ncbi:MAG: carbohydrate-binding family 9-like protein [Planctomycetes bacterium]|nr:carbohydrate-binding family 9-like protein [Planctomycetota bacterium]